MNLMFHRIGWCMLALFLHPTITKPLGVVTTSRIYNGPLNLPIHGSSNNFVSAQDMITHPADIQIGSNNCNVDANIGKNPERVKDIVTRPTGQRENGGLVRDFFPDDIYSSEKLDKEEHIDDDQKPISNDGKLNYRRVVKPLYIKHSYHDKNEPTSHQDEKEEPHYKAHTLESSSPHKEELVPSSRAPFHREKPSPILREPSSYTVQNKWEEPPLKVPVVNIGLLYKATNHREESSYFVLLDREVNHQPSYDGSSSCENEPSSEEKAYSYIRFRNYHTEDVDQDRGEEDNNGSREVYIIQAPELIRISPDGMYRVYRI